MLTGLLIVVLSLVAVSFETLAQQHKWIAGGFPQSVFPIDPAQPLTYLDLVLTSLPFLIAPLIVLPIAHGVSWRRAFSYGVEFQWRQFWSTAVAFLCVATLGLIVSYLVEPKQIQFPARAPGFVVWVVLAIGVIFVQSFGEEVLFRGYLLRVWGAVLPYRLPVTGAVIAIFVAGHLGNEDLQKDLLLNVVYFAAVEVISYAAAVPDAESGGVRGLALDEQRRRPAGSDGAGAAHRACPRGVHRSRLCGGREPPARSPHPHRQPRRGLPVSRPAALAPLTALPGKAVVAGSGRACRGIAGRA